MRRSFAALAVCVLTLAGCGGSGHHTGQRAYHTKYGVQAHSPTFGLTPKGVTLPGVIAPTAIPTLEMFDTVTLSTVPSNPAAVAGYTSGSWPTYNALVRAYPHAFHVSIAVTASRAPATCLDIEPGDAPPGQAAGWVRWDASLGVTRPCLYSSLSEMQSVRANLAANGIPRSAVRLWDADWTYYPHLDAGYDATQWSDHALGRNLDESTVARSFFGPLPPAGVRCFGPGAKVRAKACAQIRPRVSRLSRERDQRNGEIRYLRRRLIQTGCRDKHGHDVKHPAKFCAGFRGVGDFDHARVRQITVFINGALVALYQ